MVLFLNQKLDLLKFQNELPTKMDNYIGTLYKTESLNCKDYDLKWNFSFSSFVIIINDL
jgi:hypothetical protein